MTTKKFYTKTQNKISNPQQMGARKNMQLGKPMSTKDYFSQKEYVNLNAYYVKKPVLMEMGSSKNTRPSNKENSLANPQSTYKLDGNMPDNRNFYRMSPDQNFSSGLQHHLRNHGFYPKMHSGIGQSLNTQTTVKSASRVN